MKILIPTNDNITIASEFDNARAYRVLTIIDGNIKEDVFVQAADESKYSFSLEVFLNENDLVTYHLKRGYEIVQQVAFAKTISQESEKILLKSNYELYRTKEIYIHNAITSYVKAHVTMECDYCCCP